MITGLSLIVAGIFIFISLYLNNKLDRLKLFYAQQMYDINLQHVTEQQKFHERSKIVNKGLISQEMVPLIPGFPYAFKDARRAVHPLDYIVFDGLSDGNLKEVIFLEIKTGKTNALSPNERQIKKAIDKGKVRYEIFNPDKLSQAGLNPDKPTEIIPEIT
jgi:predicted Holliday junction resolvase-like endonuclease